MATKKVFAFVALFALISCLASFFLIYYITDQKEKAKFSEISERRPTQERESAENADEYIMVSQNDRVSEDTQFVYQYYYSLDKKTEELKDSAPDYIVGMNFSDMMEYYSNWQIISFSDKQVVMRKIINDSSQRQYIIGEKDGYIAVFYESEPSKGDNNLRELTAIPVNSLAEDERAKLTAGIEARGDEELYRILEDYGS